jgi:hypothetical protein
VVSEDNLSEDKSSTIGGTGSSRGSRKRIFGRGTVAVTLSSLRQKASVYCPGVR